jgi:hypothetical protein
MFCGKDLATLPAPDLPGLLDGVRGHQDLPLSPAIDALNYLQSSLDDPRAEGVAMNPQHPQALRSGMELPVFHGYLHSRIIRVVRLFANRTCEKLAVTGRNRAFRASAKAFELQSSKLRVKK